MLELFDKVGWEEVWVWLIVFVDCVVDSFVAFEVSFVLLIIVFGVVVGIG